MANTPNGLDPTTGLPINNVTNTTGVIAPNVTPNTNVVAPTGTAALIDPSTLNAPSTTAGTVTAAPVTAAAPATASNATAANTTGVSDWNVDPNQTVQSQISGVIAANSPLMQQARAQAQEAMNARGLNNSSIAIGAGENAVIANALPIAQADAATYGKAAATNAAAANTNQEFNVGQTNTANLQNAQLNTQTSQFNVGQKNQVGEFNSNQNLQASTANANAANALQLTNVDNAFKAVAANALATNTLTVQNMQDAIAAGTANADNATKVQVQKMANDAQTAITQITAGSQQLLQGSASAQGIISNTINGITQTMLSTSLAPADKQTAIQNQLALMKTGIQTIGLAANLDLSKYLNFTVGTPTGGG